MALNRVIILIDGSNFYHRLRDLNIGKLGLFGYRNFADFLAQGRLVTSQKYYIGAIREESGNSKSRQLMANQQRLLSHLKNQGWEVELGHMLKNQGIYHEKGVDVLMATDLLAGAYEDTYDTAILVSSDTDLIPAIDKVRIKGKQVEYVGFSRKPSYGLITHTDERRLLTKKELEQFLA
jgi:uncharacterized LabA/DUF88 family protein